MATQTEAGAPSDHRRPTRRPRRTRGSRPTRRRALEPRRARARSRHAIRRGEGELADMGPFVAVTAPHTGRSPNDKFVVQRARAPRATSTGARSTSRSRRSSSSCCCADVQRVPERRATSCSCRTSTAAPIPTHRLSVRYVTPNAWHMAFVRNMFIRPEPTELADVRRRTSRCCTRRSSRPTRRGTARAPARSSCSTSRAA